MPDSKFGPVQIKQGLSLCFFFLGQRLCFRAFTALEQTKQKTGSQSQQYYRRACERTEWAEPHLQLPPQAALAAADTVHDPGDVFEVEAELLLRDRERDRDRPPSSHAPPTDPRPHPAPLTPPTAATLRKLLFSPSALPPPACAQRTWTSRQSASGTP